MASFEPDCSAFDQMIEAYLDGELSAAEVRSIESHVAECQVCAEELSLARRVSEGLAELTPLNCPDVVTARVRHKMAALGGRADPAAGSRIRRRAWSNNIWKIAAAVLVVAVGVMLAALQWRNSRPVDSASLHDAYTPEEVTLAKRQLEWTLAYVEDVTRSSMESIGRNVIDKRVNPPMRTAVNILLALEEREENAIR